MVILREKEDTLSSNHRYMCRRYLDSCSDLYSGHPTVSKHHLRAMNARILRDLNEVSTSLDLLHRKIKVTARRRNQLRKSLLFAIDDDESSAETSEDSEIDANEDELLSTETESGAEESKEEFVGIVSEE